MLGDEAVVCALVLGALQVQIALGRLTPRGQTRLFGRHLCELRQQLRQRRVLAEFKVEQGALMLGAHQIVFARLLLETRGHALAVDLVFGNQSLESFLLGRRGLKAQRNRLQLVFLIAGNGTGSCRMRSRERALQHRHVAAKLTFFLQQHHAAVLELLLELDDSWMSASAICRLRLERLDRPPTLGLVLVGQHRELQRFSDRRFDLITGSLRFFIHIAQNCTRFHSGAGAPDVISIGSPELDG
jgi:hypothetical protein